MNEIERLFPPEEDKKTWSLMVGEIAIKRSQNAMAVLAATQIPDDRKKQILLSLTKEGKYNLIFNL